MHAQSVVPFEDMLHLSSTFIDTRLCSSVLSLMWCCMLCLILLQNGKFVNFVFLFLSFGFLTTMILSLFLYNGMKCTHSLNSLLLYCFLFVSVKDVWHVFFNMKMSHWTLNVKCCYISVYLLACDHPHISAAVRY